MISIAAKWHHTRQQEIIKQHPEILALKTYDPLTLIPIFLFPVIQLACAYYSQYLSIWTMFILAWTVGGFANFSMFNNGHEITHDLIHPKIKGSIREWILHISMLPMVNIGHYILASWGHVKSHHPLLGHQSVAEAENFLNIENPDIELLADRYYYELFLQPHEKARPFIRFAYENKYLRMIFGFFIYPIISGILIGSIVLPIYLIFLFIKSFFEKNNTDLYIQRLRSIMTQLLLTYLTLALLYYLAGALAILYLFISEACHRGLFFNPGVLFVLTTHRTTWDKKGNAQPTCSIGGRWMTYYFLRANYHIEHHDFPNIPRRYLPKIAKVAPEFYEPLYSFKGAIDAFWEYFNSPQWIYAGESKNESPE